MNDKDTPLPKKVLEGFKKGFDNAFPKMSNKEFEDSKLTPEQKRNKIRNEKILKRINGRSKVLKAREVHKEKVKQLNRKREKNRRASNAQRRAL